MNIYKSFKKPVKTMVFIDVARVGGESHGGDSTRTCYVIKYSYTDNGGVRRTNTFKRLQNVGKTGARQLFTTTAKLRKTALATVG